MHELHAALEASQAWQEHRKLVAELRHHSQQDKAARQLGHIMASRGRARLMRVLHTLYSAYMDAVLVREIDLVLEHEIRALQRQGKLQMQGVATWAMRAAMARIGSRCRVRQHLQEWKAAAGGGWGRCEIAVGALSAAPRASGCSVEVAALVLIGSLRASSAPHKGAALRWEVQASQQQAALRHWRANTHLAAARVAQGCNVAYAAQLMASEEEGKPTLELRQGALRQHSAESRAQATPKAACVG